MSIFSAIGSFAKKALDYAPIAAPLVGAYMQSSAAKSAAKTQERAAQAAAAQQQQQYGAARADLQPFLASAQTSLARLNQLLGTAPGGANNGALMRDFGPADFQVDPGYQFRLAEGGKAIENSAAARGMQLSGATLKGLTRFNQDTAADEYQRAYMRDAENKNRQYNYLTGQASAQPASFVAGAGLQSGRGIADSYLEAANARATRQVAPAQAYGNALSDISSYYNLRRLLGQR